MRWRLLAAAGVSGLYAAAELTAAHFSGSTALLADALHMLSDFASYAISLGILWFTAGAAATAGAGAAAGTGTTAGTETGAGAGAASGAAGAESLRGGREGQKEKTSRLTYG